MGRGEKETRWGGLARPASWKTTAMMEGTDVGNQEGGGIGPTAPLTGGTEISYGGREIRQRVESRKFLGGWFPENFYPERQVAATIPG